MGKTEDMIQVTFNCSVTVASMCKAGRDKHQIFAAVLQGIELGMNPRDDCCCPTYILCHNKIYFAPSK